MFHRKHSAGTKQKDKFRHRKAIHRIVSRPHNLKFPGGHDAFTNYFAINARQENNLYGRIFYDMNAIAFILKIRKGIFVIISM